MVLSSDGAGIFQRRKIRAVFLFRLLVIMLSSGVTGAMRTGKALTNRLHGVMFTGVKNAFNLLTLTVARNREKEITPICS